MVEVQKRHPDIVRTLIFEDGNIDMPVEETEERRCAGGRGNFAKLHQDQ
jgi:hypothetical protein